MPVANSILEKFENYQHPVFYKEILVQRGICKKACKSFHAKNHQISRNNCKVVIHYIVCTSTPVRTHSISGLKSRVMKLSILSLKILVKSGLEFILKLIEPLQRYLLSCQANSANLGRYFCTGQQQL